MNSTNSIKYYPYQLTAMNYELTFRLYDPNNPIDAIC